MVYLNIYEEPKIIVLNEKAMGGNPWDCTSGNSPKNPGGKDKGGCFTGSSANPKAGGCVGGYSVL